jgi:hypothetical protein
MVDPVTLPMPPRKLFLVGGDFWYFWRTVRDKDTVISHPLGKIGVVIPARDHMSRSEIRVREASNAGVAGGHSGCLRIASIDLALV